MIRYLGQEEKQNILPLYQTCFDDTEEYCEYYFKKRLPQNEVAVLEEVSDDAVENEFSDSLVVKGMIHVIPKLLRVGGTSGRAAESKCHYLYAVATDPAFRKQGVMGKILRKVLWDLKQKGELFTYLIPSSEENAMIYEKYGFARVMDKKVLKLAALRKCLFDGVTVRSARKEDISALSAFAQAMLEKRYAIYISRNWSYFEDIMELMEAEGGDVTLFEVDGQIKGYRIGFEDDILEEVLDDSIKELAWESEEKKPYTMARVLDISQVLNLLSVKAEAHIYQKHIYRKSIYIEVTDSVIEENNGVFLWEYAPSFDLESDSKCKQENAVLGDAWNGCKSGNHWKRVEHCKPEVSVSIEEFTAHIMGYKRIEKLPEMDVKQGFYINDYV